MGNIKGFNNVFGYNFCPALFTKNVKGQDGLKYKVRKKLQKDGSEEINELNPLGLGPNNGSFSQLVIVKKDQDIRVTTGSPQRVLDQGPGKHDQIYMGQAQRLPNGNVEFYYFTITSQANVVRPFANQPLLKDMEVGAPTIPIRNSNKYLSSMLHRHEMSYNVFGQYVKMLAKVKELINFNHTRDFNDDSCNDVKEKVQYMLENKTYSNINSLRWDLPITEYDMVQRERTGAYLVTNPEKVSQVVFDNDNVNLNDILEYTASLLLNLDIQEKIDKAKTDGLEKNEFVINKNE